MSETVRPYEEVKADWLEAERTRPSLTLPSDIYGMLLDTPCVSCKGKGVVYSRLWREWSAGFDFATEGREGAGYTQAVDNFIAAHPQPACPEEDTCPHCDGKGSNPTDAGKTLLEFMRRHS